LDSADGLKYAEEAVKLDPREPFAHYLLGLLNLDTGNFSVAISELEIAKRAYVNIPDVYFALGNAYARAGRKEEAGQARAKFKQLSAESKKGSMETVNQDRPPGVTPGQSVSGTNPKAPQ
jgi:predicted Zn-dependent protease